MMTSLDFLKKADAFKDLNDDRLRAVLNCAEPVEFEKGARFFTHGADATHVWILVEGDVELRSEPSGKDVSGKVPAVSFTSAAQAFGWTCFVPPYKYRLSGYCASEKCKVIKFKREALLSLFDADKRTGFQVMLYLIGVIGKQFEQLQDEIARRRGIEIMSGW
ncbi:MAG: cyclic nucleotide-binding domain-containing protein [Proteobacteria bacterium]|nr:cyclic nucleotide-binding domain-containing protein [Pseudomonadota bacterium]